MAASVPLTRVSEKALNSDHSNIVYDFCVDTFPSIPLNVLKEYQSLHDRISLTENFHHKIKANLYSFAVKYNLSIS